MDAGNKQRGLAGWRAMLALAALYNLAIGVVALHAPGASVDARIIALLVGCFGLIYALAASDPLRFAPTLWVGVIGKLGVIALVLPQVRAGLAAPGTGLVLAGDALFTFGFVAFLLTRQKASQ
jgi:hypothetical protein